MMGYQTVGITLVCMLGHFVVVCAARYYYILSILLLQEIVAALEGSCNIIPVMDNFQWPLPETLPDDMRPICYFNSIRCVAHCMLSETNIELRETVTVE